MTKNYYLFPLFFVVLILFSLYVHATITEFDVEGTPYTSISHPDTDTANIIIPRLYCVYDAGFDIAGADNTGTTRDIDVVLISDVSGSMRGDMSNSDSTPRINVLRDVGKKFIDEFIISGSEQNKLSLVSYSSTARIDVSLISDATELKNIIDNYDASGTTCISCGIQSAINELDNNGRTDALKVIILMTDGIANRQIGSTSTSTSLATLQALQVACTNSDSAVNKGFVVHTISFGVDAQHTLLQNIASCSPEGKFFIGTGAQELSDIYKELGQISSGFFPQPTLNFGENNNDYDFISNIELDKTIRWVNDYCDSPSPLTDYQCKNLVDVLNYYLALCNTEEGENDCIIPVFINNLLEDGIITLNDLNIEIVEAYLGPIWTGGEHTGDYTCDFLAIELPELPEPFCGDGNETSMPDKECDWGSNNVDIDLINENGYVCIPDPGKKCRVCTTECKYIIEEDDGEGSEETYCGDGPPPDQPFNDQGDFEECDEGTNVNTWEPCTPLVAGGYCYVCSPECKLLEFTQPTKGPCIEFDSSTPVDLSPYVSFLGGRQIDLIWTYKSNTSINSFDITSNNVLTVELSGLSGQLILEVSDDEGRIDLACLNFVSSSQSFGVTPDAFTRLQIAKGRLVWGYYEEELTGNIMEYGPYLISAQVWQK